MIEHRVVDGRDSNATAHCSCGWRPSSRQSAEIAAVSLRVHAVADRAAGLAAQASELRGASSSRRTWFALSRKAARYERARNRSRCTSSRLLDLRSAPRSWERGPVLERARAMAGCSVEALWLDCFSLDGEIGLEELTRVLAGERSLDRAEHNVVAAALNERFADAGFGNPVDYWERVRGAGPTPAPRDGT